MGTLRLRPRAGSVKTAEIQSEKMKKQMNNGDSPKDRLSRLSEVISGKKRAFIIIYSNPDPDALASAWALKEIMHRHGVSARIGYTGEVGRLENEAMINLLKIPAAPVKEKDLSKADLIAVVDAQPGFFKEFHLPRCDVVIDHHPNESSHKDVFADIRPKCLAASSILLEYLMTSKTPVSRMLATALSYGIQVDSKNQQRKPCPVDEKALLFLSKKADNTLIRRIEFSSYSLRSLDYFSVALIKLRYSHNVLYSDVGPVPNTDICVQIADFLMRVKEANWALVSGVVGRKLIIVFRSDGYKKHAGKTAHTAFGKYGSAGGHENMGRAEIDKDNIPGGILLTQNERIEKFILQSLAKVEKNFIPIYRSLLA
jgi:nanoRNase/pAp phosphatase (c-di-AMP/oligoRNAs hydrolase)